MGEISFLKETQKLIERLEKQEENINKAANKAAKCIQSSNWVQLFGSGHSVIPTMDCFPRYGGFVGFNPIMDPRLMWTTVSGPGGAEELIWLERQEEYMDIFMRHQTWNKDDILIVVSHGGQNAAPVEMALSAKEAGLYVIAITSEENDKNKPATHSSNKKIGDIADLNIYNEVTSEDAVVSVPNVAGKVGGLSTLSAITIIQSLVSETAVKLAEMDYYVTPFASPNADGVEEGRNEKVYDEFRSRLKNKR